MKSQRLVNSILLGRQAYPAGNEVGEVFDDGEEGKDDPVGEPLRVVVLHRALQGLDGAIGGVEEAHRVSQQLNEEKIQNLKKNQREQERNQPELQIQKRAKGQ